MREFSSFGIDGFVLLQRGGDTEAHFAWKGGIHKKRRHDELTDSVRIRTVSESGEVNDMS